MASRQEALAGLTVSLPPRPTLLAGREVLLAGMDARLSGGPERAPGVIALHGVGGAGKTTVAVEYAYRHLSDVGLAWQFPAEDREVLLADFARLAAQLGAREGRDVRDPVASVHGVLATFPVDWLLVFDNVSGLDTVQRFLPPAGKGRVLITSQSATWPPGWAVEVAVLSTEAAATYLVNRTGDPDGRAAERLAEELDRLPLALEQAAAYMQATGISLADYLLTIRDRRADLLHLGTPLEHPAGVLAVLGLALSRLGDEAPAAVGLARLLACLAPEPVPLALLLAHPPIAAELPTDVVAAVGPLLGDQVAAEDAVAALRRYSLVTPAGGGLVLMHRLAQHVILSQISGDLAGQWRQTAAALVEAAIPADTKLPAAWPVCAELLPHARAVLNPTGSGMWHIADYLGFSGSFLAARDLFQLIADAHAVDLFQLIADAHAVDGAYGPEHRGTLIARAQVAAYAGRAGDGARAHAQLAELIPIFERVLGAEHPDTLTARADLAGWTGWLGNAADARDQLAELQQIRERVLGAEHPGALSSRGSLARWTGEAGNAADARDQFAALLPVDERVFGAEHPETMSARHNLARWTGEAGNAAGARDQFAALLPVVDERVFGAEHPDTLSSRSSLARWTGEAGNAAGAREQYAALLPVYERVLGPRHSETLSARHNLARWTGEAGNAAGARDQFAALLPIREQVQGREHPETLNTRISLASSTGHAGDAAGARDQYAALLPVLERALGLQHRFTVTGRGNLLYWALRSGR